MENSTHIYEKPTEDYLRVMTMSPEVSIADPSKNIEVVTAAYEEAQSQQAELLVLPELFVTGYSAADLFLNEHVRKQTAHILPKLAEITKSGPALIVGTPLEKNGVLFNCAVVLAGGVVVGAVPKSYLPNYGEFYEKRWFTSGKDVRNTTIAIGEASVPFGTDLLFQVNNTKVGIEVCEDAWAPIPPSAHAALAGAEVIVNVSTSNDLLGKAEYRKDMIANLASKLLCAYVYTSSGDGESSADVVYGGHQFVTEQGRILGEVTQLNHGSVVVDIDRQDIVNDRIANKTFADQAIEEQTFKHYRLIHTPTIQADKNSLKRHIEAHPFVPQNPETLNERCDQLTGLMAAALARRAQEAGSKGIVIGLSGGLDSTLTLLTALEAAHKLGQDASFVHTITMPGFASSDRTQDNATQLAEAFGTTHHIMPINDLAAGVLKSIGHDTRTEDVTYENTQARVRTTLLMNYANKIGGFVAGTGDLSESALGWCTYNGDHMSMFNPNTSVPKTLVKHLVAWKAQHIPNEVAARILQDIVNTPVSPELTGSGDLSQTTESIVGPYELHDFFLYNLVRKHASPQKIGYLARLAFDGTYDEPTIDKWLQSFLKRFTASQWKRDVMPNGPKIGTVALSPRGDWRMAPNTSTGWYA